MSYKGFPSHSKLAKEHQEFYDLKTKAAEYFRSNGVPQKIEGVLNEMFRQKPGDVFGYLANYFTRLSQTPVINQITGKEVFYRRGLTAVQVEVLCIIRNEEKKVSSAVMGDPFNSLSEKLDPEEHVSSSNDQSLSIRKALEWINKLLSPTLQGLNPTDQTSLDKLLSEFCMARYLEHKEILDREAELRHESLSEAPPEPTPTSAKDKKAGEKGKKGNNSEKLLPPREPQVPRLPGATAVGVLSLAVAKSAARLLGIPLYQHIRSVRDPQAQNDIHLPVLIITVLSCGKNSSGKLNLLEEVMLIPSSSQRVREVIDMGLELQCEMRRILNGLANKAGFVNVSEEGALQVGFERPDQALDLVTEACANLAFPLGSDLRLALNCAAQGLMDYSRGKYEVMSGCHKSPDELVEVYEGLVTKYPSIRFIIDPFRKEDVDQWEKLASIVGESCSLIADAASNPGVFWSEVKRLPKGTTGVVIRHYSDMTISDLILNISAHKGAETILATDTSDESIVDLAVGSGVAFLKLSGLSGVERMDKYNRLMAIEEQKKEGNLGSVDTFSHSHNSARQIKPPQSELPETALSGAV